MAVVHGRGATAGRVGAVQSRSGPYFSHLRPCGARSSLLGAGVPAVLASLADRQERRPAVVGAVGSPITTPGRCCPPSVGDVVAVGRERLSRSVRREENT